VPSGSSTGSACGPLELNDLEAGQRYALPIRDRLFRDLTGNGVEEFDLPFTVEDD
jgi:hypothetical protein